MDIVINVALSGHQDLRFSIPSVGVDLLTDTYYIRLALEDDGMSINHENITTAVISLLQYWLEKIKACDLGDVVHLPLGFWDQGIDCIEIEAIGGGLSIIYGHTATSGWAVNPLKPGDFCHNITDFSATENDAKHLANDRFLKEIEGAIIQLNGSINRSMHLDHLKK